MKSAGILSNRYNNTNQSISEEGSDVS